MRQNFKPLGEGEGKHGGREGLFLLGKSFSKELQAFNCLAGRRKKGEKRQKLRDHLANKIVDFVPEECYVINMLFLCSFALHVRLLCICWCHKHRLIKFHSIYPASDGLLWVLWRRPSGITGGGGRGYLLPKRKGPLVRGWEAYNCLSQTDRRRKRQKKGQVGK